MGLRGKLFLDECNGRFGSDGTYRYHATDTYPYIIGCYHGTVEISSGGGPGGTNTIEKFSFSSDGNASDVGDLVEGIYAPAYAQL